MLCTHIYIYNFYEVNIFTFNYFLFSNTIKLIIIFLFLCHITFFSHTVLHVCKCNHTIYK